MTWLDTIFVILIVLGAVRGLLTGHLVTSLIIFALWVTGIAVAVNFEEQLGSSIGDYSWAPLLAFFIILGIVLLILYGSGIPAMVARNITWRPPRWLDLIGGMVAGGLIAAMMSGIIWRVLDQIAYYLLTETSVGADNAFIQLVADSALRENLTAFVDWFAPPVGIVIGGILGAALVALAAFGRIRRAEADDDADAFPRDLDRPKERNSEFTRGVYRGSRSSADAPDRGQAGSEPPGDTGSARDTGDSDYNR
jgi:hypothetical protein